MIDFWLAATVLILVALAFLLIPVVRARRAQTEEDRTALNVALYQERVAELQTQFDAGILSAEQFEAGRAEGARELLDDTEERAKTDGRLGKAIPLALALVLPVVGAGLYLHWGASDALELTRELKTEPKSFEEMVSRLERSVEVQPEWAESWYFLGRAYLAQEKPDKAAKAFEQAVTWSERDPALLGMWAQAQYFAADRKWSDDLQAITEEALAADPKESTSLGLMGIVSFEKEAFAEAVSYWQRLLAVLPEQDPSRSAIINGIKVAAQRGNLEIPEIKQGASLTVLVALDPEVASQVKPDDTVFVFVRAESGPPMPLAAKRLTVAELPAQITLSDADAMMPGLNLSSQARVQLVARVSREGNPTQGEWAGASAAIANDAKGLQQLVIDQKDQ